jgi:L-fuculose-phosphate aldolase
MEDNRKSIARRQTVTTENELREMILEIGKRMWSRGFVAANDGNISARVGENEILTTPTGVSKGHMVPEMIIRMDLDGNLLSRYGDYRPTSEVKMHLEAYRHRDDIGAVVHAHPPFCTSFAVAGIALDKMILPEAILSLGAVSIAPYGTPSTHEVPDSILPIIEKSDALLLANHGALTLGDDLMAAYFRLETLEHSARILHLALQLGNANPVPGEKVAALMELRERMKISGRVHIPGFSERGKA